MKPRVFKRAGWWRQIGPGLTIHAAPTIPKLSATVEQRAEDPCFMAADEIQG
jgi:hypothetical protein